MNDAHTQSRAVVTFPQIAKRQLSWFHRYVSWYLRRNFHGLHLLRLTTFEQLEGLPLLICLNHPSWWDPLVGLFLSQRFFVSRDHIAPIAAEGLAKYKFFEGLGFFGVVSGTRQGAFRFLQLGRATLARSDAALWVTPQGKFTDVRAPVVIEPGVGHIVRSTERFAMLPLALEYSFWNERLPEAFACFGLPVIGHGGDRSPSGWNALFTQSLQETVNALSTQVALRNPAMFEPLIAGRAGVGGFYDLWRASKARLRGRRWQPEHGGN